MSAPLSTRQINKTKWMDTAKFAVENELSVGDNTIIEIIRTGWVYLVYPNYNDKIVYCQTYKIAADPFNIKKSLYDYTINNGHLINSFQLTFTELTEYV